MKISFYLFIFIAILAPVSTHAAWYWLTIPEDSSIGEFTEMSAAEYAVTNIPKGQLQILPESFMEILDSTVGSVKCSDKHELAVQELRDFDATHELYIVTEYKFEFDTSVNQETIDKRNQLFVGIEDDAEECLDQEQKEIQEADRTKEIEKALEECDLDFFKTDMTNEERMDTWDEREACKNKIEEVSVEQVEAPEEKEEIQTIPDVPEIAYVSPPAPSIIKPQQDSEIIEINDSASQATDMSVESSVTTDGASSTTLEAAENVEPEEEVIDEAEQDDQSEHQPKPSFIKRVINFVFGWFN